MKANKKKLFKNIFVSCVFFVLIFSCENQNNTKHESYYISKVNLTFIKGDIYFSTLLECCMDCPYHPMKNNTIAKDIEISNSTILYWLENLYLFDKHEYSINNDINQISISGEIVSKNLSRKKFCIGNFGLITFNNKSFKNLKITFLTRLSSGFYCYIHPELYRNLPEYFMIKKFRQLGGKIEDKSSLYKVVDKGIGEDSIPYEIIKPL